MLDSFCHQDRFFPHKLFREMFVTENCRSSANFEQTVFKLSSAKLTAKVIKLKESQWMMLEMKGIKSHFLILKETLELSAFAKAWPFVIRRLRFKLYDFQLYGPVPLNVCVISAIEV